MSLLLLVISYLLYIWQQSYEKFLRLIAFCNPNATVFLSAFGLRGYRRLCHFERSRKISSALISLHPPRYRVPLSCPFHVPCTSLATNRPFRPVSQVKIHDSLPTTHLRPTYYPSTTYGATGTGPCHSEGGSFIPSVGFVDFGIQLLFQKFAYKQAAFFLKVGLGNQLMIGIRRKNYVKG